MNLSDTFPTADLVARAIVAAAKETGANPEEVAMGVTVRGGRNGDYEISRARAYAAMAIKAQFPDCHNASIARMVGAKWPTSYIGGIEFQQRNGNMKWWNAAALKRVIDAIKPRPHLAHVSDEDRPRTVDRLRQGEYGALPGPKKPAGRFAVVTSEFMGDPPPGRSALDKRSTPA